MQHSDWHNFALAVSVLWLMKATECDHYARLSVFIEIPCYSLGIQADIDDDPLRDFRVGADRPNSPLGGVFFDCIKSPQSQWTAGYRNKFWMTRFRRWELGPPPIHPRLCASLDGGCLQALPCSQEGVYCRASCRGLAEYPPKGRLLTCTDQCVDRSPADWQQMPEQGWQSGTLVRVFGVARGSAHPWSG